MSADNGVYILETSTEWKRDEYMSTRFEDAKRHSVYRVAEAGAIDNLDWYEKNQPYNLGFYMNEIWGRSKIFYDLEEARKEAFKIHDKTGYTEYGICSICMKDYVFPGDIS